MFKCINDAEFSMNFRPGTKNVQEDFNYEGKALENARYLSDEFTGLRNLTCKIKILSQQVGPFTENLKLKDLEKLTLIMEKTQNIKNICNAHKPK